MTKKRKLLNIFKIIMLTVIGIALPCSIAYAITVPDEVGFTTGGLPQYRVFENVLEDGDMLFIAGAYVHYATPPTDYTAKEAFLFQVLSVNGTTPLYTKSLNDYGYRPIGIYRSAANVTNDGLVSGSAYIFRIIGNPLVFSDSTNTTATETLGVEDYIDQSIGADSDIPTENQLRNFCILIAEKMETYDTPTDDYIDFLQGYSYLSPSGGSLFMQGVSRLQEMCPILFSCGINTPCADVPESTGSYATYLTPERSWGQLTADGLTNIGVYLGINQALAGSVVLFLLVILLGVYIYSRTQSGVTVLLMVTTTPFVGAFLGLMPMVMAFIFLIIIVILVGWYFFTRGAL